MALAVEWLPEEWPDGIPNLKQLLVVAPLTPPSYSSLQRKLHPSPGGRSPPGNGPGTCLPPNLVNLFVFQFQRGLTFPIFHSPSHLLSVHGDLAANRCSHFPLILQHHLIGVLIREPATVQNACQKSAGVIFAVALPFVCNSARVRNGEHVALGCVLDYARVGLVPVALPKSDERIILRSRPSAPVIHVSHCLGSRMANVLVRYRQCVLVWRGLPLVRVVQLAAEIGVLLGGSIAHFSEARLPSCIIRILGQFPVVFADNAACTGAIFLATFAHLYAAGFRPDLQCDGLIRGKLLPTPQQLLRPVRLNPSGRLSRRQTRGER